MATDHRTGSFVHTTWVSATFVDEIDATPTDGWYEILRNAAIQYEGEDMIVKVNGWLVEITAIDDGFKAEP